MVEAAPASPLEVAKADLLFEFVVVALNAPAQLGGVDQLTESNVRRKRREPIFGGCFLVLRPFDQQPFLRPAFGEPVISYAVFCLKKKRLIRIEQYRLK